MFGIRRFYEIDQRSILIAIIILGIVTRLLAIAIA